MHEARPASAAGRPIVARTPVPYPIGANELSATTSDRNVRGRSSRSRPPGEENTTPPGARCRSGACARARRRDDRPGTGDDPAPARDRGRARAMLGARDALRTRCSARSVLGALDQMMAPPRTISFMPPRSPAAHQRVFLSIESVSSSGASCSFRASAPRFHRCQTASRTVVATILIWPVAHPIKQLGACASGMPRKRP